MADQQLVPSVAVEKFDLIKPKLPKPVQEGYEWHNEDNRRQAVEGAEALWLALRYNVQPQVFIYQEKLLDLYHKDQADCVHDVIQRETGYNGFVYQSTKKPTTKFRQQLEKEWDSTKGYSGEWVNRWFEYERLDTYAKPIPIHALRVL